MVWHCLVELLRPTNWPNRMLPSASPPAALFSLGRDLDFSPCARCPSSMLTLSCSVNWHLRTSDRVTVFWESAWPADWLRWAYSRRQHHPDHVIFQLKLATFDVGLAGCTVFTGADHYGLMAVVSGDSCRRVDAVGSVWSSLCDTTGQRWAYLLTKLEAYVGGGCRRLAP